MWRSEGGETGLKCSIETDEEHSQESLKRQKRRRSEPDIVMTPNTNLEALLDLSTAERSFVMVTLVPAKAGGVINFSFGAEKLAGSAPESQWRVAAGLRDDSRCST